MTSKEELMFKCELCGKVYHSKKSLNNHYLIHHPTSLLHLNLKSLGNKRFSCDHCSERFSYGSCLMRHKRFQHPEHAPTKLEKIKLRMRKCPVCDTDMPKSSIIQHFQIQHDIEIATEQLEFPSHTGFLAWKESMESRTLTRFVKEKGDVTKGDQSFSSYICHRSGVFKSAGQQKRQMKLQGTCKINGFCPAYVKVTKFSDGKCRVGYVNTHVGHDFDLRHLCLSGKEKEAIAEKLASENSFDEILDELRGSIDEDNIKRFDLVTRKDLHNIRKSFNQRSVPQTHIDEPEPEWALK